MDDDDEQRLDKWLWAARFFKTRSLAQQAIEAGRVHVGGAPVKPARVLRAGKSLAFGEIDIAGADGKSVCRASTTYAVL